MTRGATTVEHVLCYRIRIRHVAVRRFHGSYGSRDVRRCVRRPRHRPDVNPRAAGAARRMRLLPTHVTSGHNISRDLQWKMPWLPGVFWPT